MRIIISSVISAVYLLSTHNTAAAAAWSITSSITTSPIHSRLIQPKNPKQHQQQSCRQSPLFLQQQKSKLLALSASSSPSSPETSSSDAPSSSQKNQNNGLRSSKIRALGGRWAFDTKYGALNPYAIFYGLTAIFLGIPWYLEMKACQLMYFLSRERIDRKRRVPIFFSHLWGMTLMFLTNAFPVIENKHILKEFYKTKQAAMFVANHNSWQDIPYLGATIGWKNYKIIAKKELEKVPILSSAILQGGHVILDRASRRSQLVTLKKGIQWLKDGVFLCTFPEGTRSRSGKLQPFKNGAFKMAYKCGAPVVPLSIVGAGNVMPPEFMFPLRRARKVARVVIHEPIYPEGKTEEELAREVREAVISGLPEDQRP